MLSKQGLLQRSAAAGRGGCCGAARVLWGRRAGLPRAGVSTWAAPHSGSAVLTACVCAERWTSTPREPSARSSAASAAVPGGGGMGEGLQDRRCCCWWWALGLRGSVEEVFVRCAQRHSPPCASHKVGPHSLTRPARRRQRSGAPSAASAVGRCGGRGWAGGLNTQSWCWCCLLCVRVGDGCGVAKWRVFVYGTGRQQPLQQTLTPQQRSGTQSSACAVCPFGTDGGVLAAWCCGQPLSQARGSVR